MTALSVVIITRNEAENIIHCLASVKPLAAEIVVVDSGSTDDTVAICRAEGCRVFERVFDGYGTQKQFAVDQTSNSWVLSVDADEVVTRELQQEIQHLLAEIPETIQSSHPAGYLIPFSLWFMGRVLKHGGVGHEVHLRLFDRNRGGFTTVPVHEGIEVNGPVATLRNPMLHYSYSNITHHIEKINRYTSEAAEGYLKRGKRFRKGWAVIKFPISFITFYFVKRGFLDGYPGFMWSFLAAVYATLKVTKTIELTQRQ